MAQPLIQPFVRLLLNHLNHKFALIVQLVLTLGTQQTTALVQTPAVLELKVGQTLA